MKIKINQNAKNNYLYCREYCKDFDFNKIREISYATIKKGKYSKTYYKLYCGFDIETYTDQKTTYGFMYIWSFSIDKIVIYGKTWEEFIDFINGLCKHMKTVENNKYIIVWVANLGYEFQFMRKYLNVVDSFSKQKRKPLYITCDNNIEFRECLTISGGGLSYLAKLYCNTQKCVGDLNYKLARNSLTPLTEDEEGYCDNDVLILSEWSKYVFDTYINNGFLPLTRTQLIIKEMNEYAYKDYGEKKGFKRYIKSLYPSEDDYIFFMKFLFRGGYSHGNILYTGEIVENVYSYDFTSSYPSVMMKRYFPLFFKDVKPTIENVEKHYNDCFIILVTFFGLKNTTPHSIESRHKCIKLVNPTIDNGRILSADEIKVCITELDYKIYEKFYKWDKMVIHYMATAKKIKMYNHVKKTIEHWYTDKALLKMRGKPYAIEKENVNIIYGASVKRFNNGKIIYNGDWDVEDTGLNYESQIKNSPMPCYFGIYITAHARYNLLSVLYEMEISSTNISTTLYCDTDSIKFINEKNIEIIKKYNRCELKKNLKMCIERDLSFSIYGDLGLFDNEGKIDKLKYLGAKRYIIQSGDKIKTTIAGLPKNALVEYCDRKKLNIFDFFSNNMYIEMCGKNTSFYHDTETELEVTDYLGNTETMKELTSIGLCETSFNLSVDEEWLKLIFEKYEEYETRRLEKRYEDE